MNIQILYLGFGGGGLGTSNTLESASHLSNRFVHTFLSILELSSVAGPNLLQFCVCQDGFPNPSCC